MQSLLLRRTPALTRRGVLTDIGHFTRFYSCRSILQRDAWASRLQKRHVFPSTSIPQRIHSQPSSRTYTTSQKTDISYADPHRPDLYYHLMYAPTPASADQPVFALSFLEVSPPDLDSATVIGWLPAVTYTTDTPGTPEEQVRGHEPTLDDFVPNVKFVELLHDTVRHVLKEGLDEIWENGAKQLQEGWMHINDQRNIPALGRIGDPDDIIGSVLVEESKINAETYQPMPSYRLCTSDGVLQLTPGIAKHLRQTLLKYTQEGK
ncbi:hypothetical protein CVT26_004650 [Gymnopilus dilepis]|uniref:Uncharacterized protein n=1 Tax=Gymnopilus dilepis TaxID=231916 RepID=A0A409YTU4_9AGAR|nr:hypothetical protein CVT26_004650 [Gymnopilus dilepis]